MHDSLSLNISKLSSSKSFLDTFCLSYQTCCTQQLVIKIEKNLIFWEVKKNIIISLKNSSKNGYLNAPIIPQKKLC